MKKLLSILFTLATLYGFGQANYDHLGKIRMIYGGKTTTLSYSADTTLFANDSKVFKFSGLLKVDSLSASGTIFSPWVLNLKADKVTTMTASYGLSGGGSLAANRTFKVDTASITSVYANSLKANKAITLTANYGLNGGGDLSANRAFEVDTAELITPYANSLKANKTTTISAGFGLVGGGDLSTNRAIAIDTAMFSVLMKQKADTAITLTAGYGLNGGGNLANSRSFVVDTAEVTSVYANSLKANNNISISSGFGLSGGGDLTTTRTLSVDSSSVATTYDISLKEDKVAGKGLSTNDYSNAAVANVLYATPRLAASWNDTLYFNRIYTFYNQKKISAGITVKLKATGTIQGSQEKIVFIGDSVNAVNFGSFKKMSQSLSWNDSLTNFTTFTFDGVDVWYYITR
jgi:hypothetical protein